MDKVRMFSQIATCIFFLGYFQQLGMFDSTDSTDSTVNQSFQLAMQTAFQWAQRMIKEGQGEELQRLLRATQTCKLQPPEVIAVISKLSQSEVNWLLDKIARESAINKLDNEQKRQNNLKEDLDALTLIFHQHSRQKENGQQAHHRQLSAKLIKVQQLSANAFITFLTSIEAGSTAIESFKYYSGQIGHMISRYINCQEIVLTEKEKALIREKLKKEGGRREERVAEREEENLLSIGEREKKKMKKQREQMQGTEQERKEKDKQRKLKIKEALNSRQSDKDHDQKDKKNKKKKNKSQEAYERVYRESIPKVKIAVERTSRSQEHEKPVRRNSVSHK